jgi:hypothetical protein
MMQAGGRNTSSGAYCGVVRSSSCLGFESGVRDFRREAGTRHMVGTSMVDMGEYGAHHGEYHGSFNVDIHLVEVHASEFIPVSVTFVGVLET